MNKRQLFAEAKIAGKKKTKSQGYVIIAFSHRPNKINPTTRARNILKPITTTSKLINYLVSIVTQSAKKSIPLRVFFAKLLESPIAHGRSLYACP